MNKLEVKIRQVSGVSVLDLAGDLSGMGEQQFNTALDQIERTGANGVIINFTEIDYINSTGIGLIVRLLNKARQKHQVVAACGVKSYYTKIFDYTRISQYMQIYPDEETALLALSEPLSNGIS